MEKVTITCRQLRSGQRGRILLETAGEESLRYAERFFREKAAKEAETSKPWTLEVTIARYRPKKTLAQLGLLFSLCEIMALEQEGNSDEAMKQRYYRGLLELYAPREKVAFTEREVPKTASSMNVMELAKVIEGAFRELSYMSVSLEGSQSIRGYMIEWRNWRGKVRGGDPLRTTYKNLEEYRRLVPYCEACLENAGEHMAHIVSRGAGGENFETWNFLHLCATCHLSTQHTRGWVELLRKWPHLLWKVNDARKTAGLDEIRQPDDLLREAGDVVDVDRGSVGAGAVPADGDGEGEKDGGRIPLF